MWSWRMMLWIVNNNFDIIKSKIIKKITLSIELLACLNSYAQSKSFFDKRYYDHWEAIDSKETLNVILDKINEVGLDNLTATELKFLDTFDYWTII